MLCGQRVANLFQFVVSLSLSGSMYDFILFLPNSTRSVASHWMHSKVIGANDRGAQRVQQPTNNTDRELLITRFVRVKNRKAGWHSLSSLIHKWRNCSGIRGGDRSVGMLKSRLSAARLLCFARKYRISCVKLNWSYKVCKHAGIFLTISVTLASLRSKLIRLWNCLHFVLLWPQTSVYFERILHDRLTREEKRMHDFQTTLHIKI